MHVWFIIIISVIILVMIRSFHVKCANKLRITPSCCCCCCYWHERKTKLDSLNSVVPKEKNPDYPLPRNSNATTLALQIKRRNRFYLTWPGWHRWQALVSQKQPLIPPTNTTTERWDSNWYQHEPNTLNWSERVLSLALSTRELRVLSLGRKALLFRVRQRWFSSTVISCSDWSNSIGAKPSH